MNDLNFRKATEEDKESIWLILQQAIERRRKDGSDQWQDGYPNLAIVEKDIKQNYAHVLTQENKVLAYAALIFNDEPAYKELIGNWLTNGDFLVVHRIAISNEYIGKGFAKEILRRIENQAISNKIPSIKVDTNFDNFAMLHILEQMGYQYCGEVFFRGAPRKAFEKVL